jgi:hypothetical protein
MNGSEMFTPPGFAVGRQPQPEAAKSSVIDE